MTVLYAIFYVGMFLKAWWDFTHPRQWDCAGDDPHVYVRFLLVCVAITASVLGGIFVSEYRRFREGERKARFDVLVKHAETLIREKRFQEAEECLGECKRMMGDRWQSPH